MGWQAWLTVAVLLATLVGFARRIVSPSVTVLGGVALLLVAGVIDPSQAFSGFSNPAPITVAALYVLARAVEKTGALQPIVSATLGAASSSRRALARLLFPSAAASAFLNNTPIVAMLAPQVSEWADRVGISPSRFLMPLSFAAILGGMVTAIGTSTNLVVSGLLEASGAEPLGMFEITRIGLPVALVGLVVLVLSAPALLPDRRPARRELGEEEREFVVSMEVVNGGPLDGVAVEKGGLRHLQGVFLVEIEREGEFIAPVAPTMVLRGGDRLVFVGRADLVVDLHSTRGLVSSERHHLAVFGSARHTFFEAVVGAASRLVGKSLKEAAFRGRYQGAVVAIHRAGHRVRGKLGSVKLKAGDTLLILGDPDFRARWRDRSDFLVVAPLGGTPPPTTAKAWLVALIGAGIVVGAALGILPILHLSLVGAIALVGLGVLSPGEARSAIDLDVIVVIASAFGLGAALETTGLAARLAHFVVGVFGPLGPTGGLLGIVLAAALLMTVITNNATAVLMFPIAMATAHELGLNPRAFAITVAVAASASFLTPIAYQTNLMVYGPGGYRFGDYARLGALLTVVVTLGVLLWVPAVWGL